MLDHGRKGQKWITEEFYKVLDVYGFRAVMFVEWGFRPADVKRTTERIKVPGAVVKEWVRTARQEEELAREAEAGRIYTCGSQTLGGYPFRIEVDCVTAAAEFRGIEPPLEGHTDDEAFGWVIDAIEQSSATGTRRRSSSSMSGSTSPAVRFATCACARRSTWRSIAP